MDSVCRDPLEDARRAGLSVSMGELGDWFPATLVAEYDRASRAIRVNRAAVRRVCRVLAGVERDDLVRAAVAHELYHHEVAEGRIAGACNRKAAERGADRFVRARYGIDPSRFEGTLR